MSPLTAMPFGASAAVMAVTSFVALTVMTRRTLSACGTAMSPGGIVLASLAALTLEPVWSTFSFGQINLLIAALCLIDLTGPRTRFRGVLTGVAAGLKLTPLFFVLYLLVTRQYRSAAVATGTFLLTVGVGFVVNPSAASTFWTSAIEDSSRVGAAYYSGNQSLRGVVLRVLDGQIDDGVLTLLQAALAVVVLAAAVLVHRRGATFASVVAASFGMLGASPISWSHHWVWAWPALLCLVTHHSVRHALAGAVWGACFTSRILWWPPAGGDKELTWTPLEKVAGSLYLIAALWWIVWAVRRARGRCSPRR